MPLKAELILMKFKRGAPDGREEVTALVGNDFEKIETARIEARELFRKHFSGPPYLRSTKPRLRITEGEVLRADEDLENDAAWQKLLKSA